MQIIEMNWRLVEQTNESVITRHCKNCGKTVEFKDSFIRRHNSNGKNIYRYAIFKCEKGHTWNQKLSIYKAFTDHAIVKEEIVSIEEKDAFSLDINLMEKQGIGQIRITMDQVIGGFRLDKLLSERIHNWSRASIVGKIKEGTILINQDICKPSRAISTNDLITIMI